MNDMTQTCQPTYVHPVIAKIVKCDFAPLTDEKYLAAKVEMVISDDNHYYNDDDVMERTKVILFVSHSKLD